MSRNLYDPTNDTLTPIGGYQSVDPALSTTSENPVQNKVVASQIQTLTNETSDIVNVLGAKNLLPNNAVSQTVNGVTFTVNSDGSITANGTATSGATLTLCSNWGGQLTDGKQYILSGCPTGGSDSTYRLKLNKTNGVTDYGDGGQEFTFNSSEYSASNTAQITVFAGTTVNNLVFNPMIRPASIADDTYVPYAMTNREITNKITDGIIVEMVYSDEVTIAGGGANGIYVTVTKAGYTPLGIVGISSFSTYLSYYEFYMNTSTKAYIGIRNTGSSSTTGSIGLLVLYKKS